MTDTNLVRTAIARKSAFGAAVPSRFRTGRMVSNGLAAQFGFASSSEIRADRMKFDPEKVSESVSGAIASDWRFANDGEFLRTMIELAFCAAYTRTPSRDNDGVADSVITAVAASTQIVTVLTGAAFAVGHLVRCSGFAQAANNGLFRVSTASATVPAFASSGLVDEAAPPAAARMKVVGFQGTSGDIAASATGLTSTALDFTTLGLQVGQWIKVGGTEAAAFNFATAGLNGWARVAAIAANALTLDHRPAGWGTDSGSGKTIRVFFGDVIKNGTALGFAAVESAYLGQASASYALYDDVTVNQFSLAAENGQFLRAQFDCVGARFASGASANGSAYDAAPVNGSMTANASLLGLYEAGALLGSPNWATRLNVSLNNNMRVGPALGSLGPVRFGIGSAEVTGQLNVYFGSTALLSKLTGVTRTSLASIGTAFHPGGSGQQAMVVTVPRVTLNGNGPTVPGENQDVTLELGFTASIDSLTQCHIQQDALEYFS